MPKGWKLGRSGVRLHNFTFFSISVFDLMIKSFSLCLPVNTLVIVSKIWTHPIFSMVQLSILRVLPLGSLSMIITKASTIWLRNSSDAIGFPLKAAKLLTWHTFPIYLI